MTGTYDLSRTAVLLVDPYNDFLSEGGKLWPLVKPVAAEVRLLDNLRTTITAARNADVPVFFVPHRRWEETNYEGWDHPNPNQRGVNQQQIFARGSWGGQFHPDFQPHPGAVVVTEHWAQSGFAKYRPGRSAETGRHHPCRAGWCRREHLRRVHWPLRDGTRLSRDPRA